MSLTKLLKAPMKLFKKEVITFLIVRRYDLGSLDDKLRYIAVRPSASISALRQKVWHLLDLPDFCEELIVLKSDVDTEIPLIELRKGNDPQHPYILEVWFPEKLIQSNTYNMLTISNGTNGAPPSTGATTDLLYVEKQQECVEKAGSNGRSQSTISNETIALNRLRVPDNKRPTNNLLSMDFKKSDISCRISNCSLFKLHSRKSRDNFTNILLKIQSDLSTLSNKLSTLETKYQSDRRI